MAQEQQWVQQLAEVEDAATEAAFQQGAQPMPQVPQEPPIRDEDEVPTEPATSPRQVDPQACEWPVQFQPVQSRACGPQPELERYPNPYVMNYGQLTPEQHEVDLHNAQQAVSAQARDRERQEEAERENRERECQREQWQAQMKAAGFLESSVPHGPPPKGISSARALPQVHQALRENDPTPQAPSTKPALPKKALQIQGEACQQGSIEQKSLQGLVRLKASHKLYSTYQQPLQPFPLRPIHKKSVQHSRLTHVQQPLYQDKMFQ